MGGYAAPRADGDGVELKPDVVTFLLGVAAPNGGVDVSAPSLARKRKTQHDALPGIVRPVREGPYTAAGDVGHSEDVHHVAPWVEADSAKGHLQPRARVTSAFDWSVFGLKHLPIVSEVKLRYANRSV